MGLLDPLLMDGFYVIIMLGGVLTVRPHPAMRYLVLFLVVLAVLTKVASKIFPGLAISVIEALLVVAAIGFFAALVMKRFLVAERPASHRIGAAIVVYLLVGILWARLYEIAGLIIPGAFHMDGGNATMNTYLYFRYVTLATIGYL